MLNNFNSIFALLITCKQCGSRSGPKVITKNIMLNSTEHGIYTTSECFKQEKIVFFSVIFFLRVVEISCSAELSM